MALILGYLTVSPEENGDKINSRQGSSCFRLNFQVGGLRRSRMRKMLDTISRDELKAKIDSSEAFTLVETLQEVAYQHEHLPGALNLPPDRVKELAPGLLPDKGAEIIVYCSSPT